LKTCPILKKRTDHWYVFSWSICDKNCHIIRHIESDTFYGYANIHESWEDYISEKEQWAKFNTDRKKLSAIEKDCFEKS
jgi:hypoxanthine phosphoribosyltransferase